MPTIILKTEINSTLEICFDLSRSIELHEISTAHTQEQAIAGTTKGLINLHETVTWQAVHFGVLQKLTSKITAYERPYYFVDEQVEGAFKSMYHKHSFEKIDGKIIMSDFFEFQSPLGILGVLFNKCILTNYLKHLLIKRNNTIKYYAESGIWKEVLPGAS